MHQLMEDDVILNERRCLDEPPVERNGPAPRAGTPARPLIANADAVHGRLMLRGERDDFWRQFFRGKTPQMFFDQNAQVAAEVGHLD